MAIKWYNEAENEAPFLTEFHFSEPIFIPHISQRLPLQNKGTSNTHDRICSHPNIFYNCLVIQWDVSIPHTSHICLYNVSQKADIYLVGQ